MLPAVRAWDVFDGTPLGVYEVQSPILRLVSAPLSAGVGAVYAVVTMRDADPTVGFGEESATISLHGFHPGPENDELHNMKFKIVKLAVNPTAVAAAAATKRRGSVTEDAAGDSDEPVVITPSQTLLKGDGLCIALRCSNRWLVAITPDYIHCIPVDGSASIKAVITATAKHCSDGMFTCGDVHPQNKFVTVGDTQGHLLHVYCLPAPGAPPTDSALSSCSHCCCGRRSR